MRITSKALKDLKPAGKTPLGEDYYEMPKEEIRVVFSQAYAGGARADVFIGKTIYILELDYLTNLLEKQIIEKGYTTSISRRQRYPRITINP